MILIGELIGARIKKALRVDRAIKRYNNKNKSGGNFGFTIIKAGNWYNLSGYFGFGGYVHDLQFGSYGTAGIPIIPESFDELIQSMKELIEASEAFHFMEAEQ